MRLNMKTEGLDQYRTLAQRMPNIIEYEVTTALTASGEIVERTAKQLAPASEGKRTSGRLRRSITAIVKFPRVYVFPRSPKARGTAMTELWYARVREHGTASLPGGVIKAKAKFDPATYVQTRKRGSRTLSTMMKIAEKRKYPGWMFFRIGGRLVRVKQVAQTGAGFMSGALARNEPQIWHNFDQAAGRIAERFERGGQ